MKKMIEVLSSGIYWHCFQGSTLDEDLTAYKTYITMPPLQIAIGNKKAEN